MTWTTMLPPGAKVSPDGTVIPRASAQLPNYNAASNGRRLRAWRVPQSGPNTAIVYDLPIIRGRARGAARNDPWAGAALDRGDANAIGTGIQAKMVNGSPELRAACKRLWNRWSEECDADGVMNLYAQQYLAWHEWREAGEVFGRLRPRRASDGLSVPLQVQVIEAEQCPTDLNTTASNGNRIRAGIEFNAIGKRVAYWMYREHPGDMNFLHDSHELVRIPANQIIHLFKPVRAGQIRGIPDQASVLVRMFNVDSMDDTILEKHKIANLFAGFYEQPIDPEAPPDSMIDELAGEDPETDDDDVPLAGLEPATMQQLPPGWTAKFTPTQAPGTDYAEFLRGHLLAIAARHGVPYEVLTGDLRNVSDRALRLILNEFRRTIEMLQWLFFIPNWCQQIRNVWFDMAFLSGALELPDYQAKRDEYVETLWVPQGWPYSHPVQDVTAEVRAIRAGLRSRTASVLSSGEDPEEVDQQNAEDNARADSHGLVYDSDARKTSAAGLTQARPSGSVLPGTESTTTEEGSDGE